jgi:hypothetical protein
VARSATFFRRLGIAEQSLSRLRSRCMAKPLQHQIIARALELISDEANWSRCAWARTARGRPCSWTHPYAAKFCAIGALNRAAFELTTERSYELAMSAERHIMAASSIPHRHLPYVNDTEGHAAIVAMFKHALAA